MQGKLIVIEGVDSSGKATQAGVLYRKLKHIGKDALKITFPNYKSRASALVKMYLGGEFGTNPEDVSPYVASTFYAADRFASFRTKWGEFYKNGGIIVADRYATSNMVHQAAKIADKGEKEKFLDWLYNMEYNIYAIPKPDVTIFLDMPPEFAIALMKNRNNKITGEAKKDIHERDEGHIIKAYENACEIADRYHWERICCVNGNTMRSIEDISNEIIAKVMNVI